MTAGDPRERAHQEAQHQLRASALVGLAVWILVRHSLLEDLLPSVMAFALLVVAPLAVGIGVPVRSGLPSLPGWVGVLQPVAAFGAVVSLALRPSWPAAVFALPWLGWTLALAGTGARRLLARSGDLSVVASAAALVLIPIGAGWLLLSRAGLDPAGFGVVIVFLTAVHFHYVALGAPTLVALAAEALTHSELPPPVRSAVIRLLRIALGSIVVGMFLVAAGITFSSWLGLGGALVLTVGLFAYAWVVLTKLLRRGSLAARALLAVSALSAVFSMPLALAWAYGQVTKEVIVDLEWMIRLHGMANAHGVVFAGLVGFWLLGRQRKAG